MSSSLPQISIVIRCLNEEKHIGKLLTGIAEQSVADVEVIVVDSGSTDATLAIASRFDVTILHIRPEDFSFGYALNVGCAAARAPILLFASAHVYPVYRDWLAEMLAPFADAQVALAYGRQIGDKVTKFSEHQVFAAWFPAVSNPDQQHPFCNNANCAVRRELWQEQPFDEQLTGLEDLDWAKKIQERGYKVAYQSRATIVHVHEEGWRSIYNRYRREAIALRTIRQEGGFNLLTFIGLWWRNVRADLRVANHQGQLARVWWEIILFRWMQFYGTYRGYKESYRLTDAIRQRFYYPADYQPTAEQNTENRLINYAQDWEEHHRTS